MPKRRRPPRYRRHKARNCAVVTIHGKNHYLGPYDSPESHEAYARLIAEHFSGDHSSSRPACKQADLTVAELILRYWVEYVEKYHVKGGKPTDRQAHIRLALRPLRELYGTTLARDFGPRRLKNVRERMVEHGIASRGGLNRKYVNDHVGIIKKMFRWAVAEELLQPASYEALRSLESLHKGRDERVKESTKVRPVAEEDVLAVLPFVSPQIGAMIELQLLTGMRPDEVTIIRPCDVDTEGDVWLYRPSGHKGEHLDLDKNVLLGPRAQRILRPWLDRPEEKYCFSPKEVVAALHAQRRKRKQDATPDDNRRTRKLRDHYDDCTYRRCVQRACAKAGVPKWSPNQLRHNVGTNLRKAYGIEAASMILGHQNLPTTEIYAERNLRLAQDIMKEAG